VIDCHTKACIGYAMAEHMRADLVIEALAIAARNYPLAEAAIFHSDRGTQYQCRLVSPEVAVVSTIGHVAA
jgi:putative transposase